MIDTLSGRDQRRPGFRRAPRRGAGRRGLWREQRSGARRARVP